MPKAYVLLISQPYRVNYPIQADNLCLGYFLRLKGAVLVDYSTFVVISPIIYSSQKKAKIVGVYYHGSTLYDVRAALRMGECEYVALLI